MAGEKREKNKDEVLYVGLQDPIEMRRTILEATKDAVEMLQNYEKFRAVREEKVKTVTQLQEQIVELTRLINKLKLELPKVDVRIKVNKEQEMIEAEKRTAKKSNMPKKKAVKEIPKKTKELSDLEKLEAELASIEQKLGKA